MSEKKFFIETFGCQMNFSDSEIVASILKDKDYTYINEREAADIILINTCSIRDNAEQRVHKRLTELKSLKNKKKNLLIGIIGCMAERLKEELLKEEKIVDMVAGPDSYRHLPLLIEEVLNKHERVSDTLLSTTETYDDIIPLRLDNNKVTAFVSIMRGCQNYCSYCVVPYTRGNERSRSHESIITDAADVFNQGYREITLLGQNVNSYKFKTDTSEIKFAGLISLVAEINPLLRIRFATSHPKDLSDELLEVIAKHKNICKSIHLPLQSGSDRILGLMNRKYTSEDYKERIRAIRSIIPECSVSTDIITGFCTETESDHKNTMEIMEMAEFDFAYMFKYSERPGTLAAKKFKDDVSNEIKTRRLNEIIELQQELSLKSNQRDKGKLTEVLAESSSKRSSDELMGRNSQNKVVIFPHLNKYKPGEYVKLEVVKFTSATLFGKPV